jgi:hypothetical protein
VERYCYIVVDCHSLKHVAVSNVRHIHKCLKVDAHRPSSRHSVLTVPLDLIKTGHEWLARHKDGTANRRCLPSLIEHRDHRGGLAATSDGVPSSAWLGIPASAEIPTASAKPVANACRTFVTNFPPRQFGTTGLELPVSYSDTTPVPYISRPTKESLVG